MSTLKVNAISDTAAANGNAFTLATDGSAIGNLSNYSRRNYIINGGFEVHQRGNLTHSYSWCGDRFQHRTGSSAVIAQSTTVPAGFAKSMSLTASSGTLALAWNTLLEAGDSLSGTDISNVYSNNSKWTVSIWATQPVKVRVDFADSFGPGNPVAIVAYTNMTSTGETSNGFTRYKHTFDIASVNPVGTNKALHIGWSLVSAAGDVKFTGAQLERGEICGLYEHLPYEQYLRDCFRYYWRTSANNNEFFPGMGMADTDGNTIILNTQFPVRMRTAPTGIEQTGTASDYKVRRSTTQTCSSVPTFGHATLDQVSTQFTKSSHGWGDGSAVRCVSGATDAYLAWGAEFP